MLSVSVQSIERNPYLLFEIEPYYRRSTRNIYTIRYLETFDKQILLRDNAFKKDYGNCLIFCLFARGGYYSDRNLFGKSLVFYPHMHGKREVLRMDMEQYIHRPRRVQCDRIDLDKTNLDKQVENVSLHMMIMEKVLVHLPVSEELCMQPSGDDLDHAYDYPDFYSLEWSRKKGQQQLEKQANIYKRFA